MYQEAERVQWDEWVAHGSVKIHSPVQATKIRLQVPREKCLHSRFAYRNQNSGLLDPAGNPAREGKSTIGHSGSALRGQCSRFGENRLHRTAVSVFLQLASSMGWCRSLRRVHVSCAFLRGKPREVEDPSIFELTSRGLPGIEKEALIEIVKGVFGSPILPVGGGKNCVTRSKETPGHLSTWTLPSSACATLRGNDHCTR